MDILDYFYNLDYSSINFFPRKYKLKEFKRALIYGAPSVGKSYIVFDYINSFDREKSLYIDLQDPKVEFNPISIDEIEEFVVENGIELVVLDHYIEGFLFRDIKVEKLIVVSHSPFVELENFSQVRVFALDFEEFFSFQKRSLEKYIFNLFLKRGTLPQLAISIDTPREELLKDFLRKNFTKLEENILVLLSHFNCSNVTSYQIYTYAKRRFRVSKDTIYKKIKEFKRKDIIFFIEDRVNRNLKKMVIFDFVLASYLSLSQNFLKQFDNMIVVSLIKHQIDIRLFNGVGYITSKNNLIIPAPFESRESALKKANLNYSLYKEWGVESVYIVTVSNQYGFRVNDIYFEAFPFYEWVLINDEL